MMTFLIIAGYFAIGGMALGVWWELQDKPDLNDLEEIFPFMLFWGIFAGAGIVFGVLWLLSWIPRGPVRLGKIYMRKRSEPDLARAEVV